MCVGGSTKKIGIAEYTFIYLYIGLYKRNQSSCTEQHWSWSRLERVVYIDNNLSTTIHTIMLSLYIDNKDIVLIWLDNFAKTNSKFSNFLKHSTFYIWSFHLLLNQRLSQKCSMVTLVTDSTCSIQHIVLCHVYVPAVCDDRPKRMCRKTCKAGFRSRFTTDRVLWSSSMPWHLFYERPDRTEPTLSRLNVFFFYRFEKTSFVT